MISSNPTEEQLAQRVAAIQARLPEGVTARGELADGGTSFGVGVEEQIASDPPRYRRHAIMFGGRRRNMSAAEAADQLLRGLRDIAAGRRPQLDTLAGNEDAPEPEEGSL